MSLLLISFFLPWISYGYIIKSGFDIPLYSEHLKSLIGFFTQGKQELPKEIIYVYALYLYPLSVLSLFKWKSAWLEKFVYLLPLLAFFAALTLLTVPFVIYVGFGMWMTLGLSLALLLQSLIVKKRIF